MENVIRESSQILLLFIYKKNHYNACLPFIAVHFRNDIKIPLHFNAVTTGVNENECRCDVQNAPSEVITMINVAIFLTRIFMQ